MSLIPTADAGSAQPGQNYFALKAFGAIINPVIVTGKSGANGAATLTLNNGGVTDPSGHPMAVTHYVTAVAGGGLTPGLYQIYMYGPDIGGNNIGELMVGAGLGNNYCSLSANRGAPLDPARMGKITGTGALQTINCPSITAASVVMLAFVGGTPAAGDVLYAIVPNTSFSLTLPAGSTYNYEVVG
jgi:hypothetical protein